MDRPILEVNHLTRRFGANVAVDDISFEVRRGEILGLLGPNGAGKTTAIRMIMGILLPDRGSVRFNLNGASGSLDKTKIGYLPEERGLYGDSNVIDNLIYLAGLKDVPPQEARIRAEEWLKKLDLSDRTTAKLDKLSKGMQQKVQFIASILHDPALVLLDEPFSGLDPINQDLFKDLIRELQSRGTTVLLSAHQMGMVEELCDRIFMINKGRRVLYGTLEEIKERYRENLVEITCDDYEALESFAGANMALRIVGKKKNGMSLRLDNSLSVNEFLEQLADAGLEIKGIKVEKPPLHEIFVNVARERGEEVEIG